MRIPEVAAQDRNKIYDPANAKKANSTEPYDTSGYFAGIESVRTKYAKKQAEPEGNPFAFVGISGTVAVDDIDDRRSYGNLLNRNLLGNADPCPTIPAKGGIAIDGVPTVCAIHRDTSSLSLFNGC